MEKMSIVGLKTRRENVERLFQVYNLTSIQNKQFFHVRNFKFSLSLKFLIFQRFLKNFSLKVFYQFLNPLSVIGKYTDHYKFDLFMVLDPWDDT